VAMNWVKPERIERLFALLFDFWQRMPEVAREIDSWDLLDQLDFTEDDRVSKLNLFAELSGYAEKGLLTAEQNARFVDLKRLMEQNRPYLDRVMAGPS
jgi:hypothetical protein